MCVPDGRPGSLIRSIVDKKTANLLMALRSAKSPICVNHVATSGLNQTDSTDLLHFRIVPWQADRALQPLLVIPCRSLARREAPPLVEPGPRRPLEVGARSRIVCGMPRPRCAVGRVFLSDSPCPVLTPEGLRPARSDVSVPARTLAQRPARIVPEARRIGASGGS